jgi:glycosyltransferase involved in cell wall biosynthesis
MRVLFFNYEFPPLGGGAGNATYYLLREYAKNPDIQVDLVTSSTDEKEHLFKMGENILIHSLPIGKNSQNIHYQSKRGLIKYYQEAYKFSKKLIKKNQYDLTHSFFTVPCGYISYKLWKKYKIPYIVSLHGSDVPGYSERFGILYKFIRPIIKKILKNAYFVIADSYDLANFALRLKSDKEIGTILDGIDTQEFFPDYSKRKSNKFTIICVSDITPNNGIRFLIQAFNVLIKRYDFLLMVIVGDGNERTSLENLVLGLGLNEKILFTGSVLYEKVLLYYQEADIFVLPSLDENIKSTILEALACGLPLIATNTKWSREFIEDGKNGLIVKANEYYDLIEKIEKFLLDKNLKNIMGPKSRELSQKFDWSIVADKYLDLYTKTINLRKIRQ